MPTHDAVRSEAAFSSPLAAFPAAIGRIPIRDLAPQQPENRWRREVQLTEQGAWHWHVRAAGDDWASWLHTADIKIEAGQDVELVFASGAALLGHSKIKVIAETR